MKKVRRTAILVIVTAMLLAACGSAAGERVDSGEIVVPEMSSEDLLASSLEYLLQEDDEAVGEPSEEDRSQETENAVEDKDKEDNTEDVRPEDVPKGNEAVIYYGNAASYELHKETIQIEEKTAEELLDALAKHNIVSLDTKVLSFEEREDAGEKILYLNLSKAAGEYLKTMSKEAECVILASIVNTFLENYDADAVCIEVDEKPLATKNAEYGTTLRRCTPEELLERIALPEEESGPEAPREQEREETMPGESGESPDSVPEKEM